MRTVLVATVVAATLGGGRQGGDPVDNAGNRKYDH